MIEPISERFRRLVAYAVSPMERAETGPENPEDRRDRYQERDIPQSGNDRQPYVGQRIDFTA